MTSFNPAIPLLLVLLAVATAHTLEGQVVVMGSNNTTESQEGNGHTPKDVVEGTPLLRSRQKKQQGHGADDGLLKLALQNPEGSLFYTLIDVGTPPTTFRVTVDSGSSNLWLMDKSLESKKPFNDARRPGHEFYNKEDSETHSNYKKRGDKPTFVFPYGDGSVCEGEMGVDVVRVQGKEITDVEFGVANKMNWEAINTQAGVDGLLGIGLQANAFNKATTLLGAMESQEIIDQDIFSLYVTPGRRSGWLVLGGVDNAMHTGGEIKFHHIVGAGSKNALRWALQFDTLQFGGSSEEEEKIVVAENFVGEFDSGASDIYAPRGVMNNIQKAISIEDVREVWFHFKKYLRIHCANVEKLPPLSFVINGQLISFSAPEYFAERIEGESDDEGELCQFFMTVGPDDKGMINIGIPFFEKYYTVFNASGKKQSIGFAEGVEEYDYHSPTTGGHPKDDSSHQKKRRRSSGRKKASKKGLFRV